MRDPASTSRRLLAAELLARGATQAEVARELGVTRTTAQRLFRIYHREGREGLLRIASRGRPRKVPPTELSRVLATLPRSWSIERVGQALEKRTGIHDHPGHLARILQDWGWRLSEADVRSIGLLDPDGHGIDLVAGGETSSLPSPSEGRTDTSRK